MHCKEQWGVVCIEYKLWLIVLLPPSVYIGEKSGDQKVIELKGIIPKMECQSLLKEQFVAQL